MRYKVRMDITVWARNKEEASATIVQAFLAGDADDIYAWNTMDVQEEPEEVMETKNEGGSR